MAGSHHSIIDYFSISARLLYFMIVHTVESRCTDLFISDEDLSLLLAHCEGADVEEEPSAEVVSPKIFIIYV